MDCFTSPEAMTTCLTIVRPWVELLLALFGLGSVGLITILGIVVARWREDHKNWTSANQRLSSDLDFAKRSAVVAESERDVCAAKLKLTEAQLSNDVSQASEAFHKAQRLLTDMHERLASARAVCVGDSADFWARPVGIRLATYEADLRDSIPIIMFANQKGGVGKTTLSAGVAACFSLRGERVLAIDLDYQGSLSGMMLAQARIRPIKEEFPSRIDQLLRRDLSDRWHDSAIQPVADKLDYVSAYYQFEKLERCVEYSWVIGDERDDVRFRLARALLSDYVQAKYNRVIIDAPRRLTLGFINGFCASTHLFVPTVVDSPSALAVGAFARQFRKLVPLINPIIRLSGVIGAMTGQNRKNSLPRDASSTANDVEIYVRNALNSADSYFIRNAVMPRSQKISYAAERGIAPLQDPRTRLIFDKLADEIAKRAPLRRN